MAKMTKQERLIKEAQAVLKEIEPQYRTHLMLCVQDALSGDTKALTKYKTMPVDVTAFVLGDYYLNAKDEEGRPTLYPEVMANLVEINEGDYDEVICTGSIGSGKSTLALYTQAYQLYLLSCMKDPQSYFGLDPSSEIAVVFQSLSKTAAQEVDYDRFRAMIERADYFKEKFPFNRSVENQLEFPNRIIVKPVSGTETGAIGQNVIGGLIDEVNFMAVVENSKLAEGGVYDQATALYNSIARRRKSRFMRNGRMPGRLCLVSSRRTPGQFTDKKEEEAKSNPRIYVYDKRIWDIKPWAFAFSKATNETEKRKTLFPIFIGDMTRQPRFVGPDEIVSDEDRLLLDWIPIEFRQDFEDDITKALRDIAGRSTLAIHPFMPQREKVVACFGKRPSAIVQESVDFTLEKVKIRNKLVAHNVEYPRWVHIDLGITSDSAGMVIGHVPRFRTVKRHGEDGVETMPVIEIDCALEIRPPKGKSGEIDFSAIRRILYAFRNGGMPIKWVSLDSFQSTDTMQILRRQGFVVGYQSIDTTNDPYDLTKQALYDGRLELPTNQKLLKELTSLERDFRKGKIDHPPKGSKDIADALAGVVYGLTMRRDVWAQHRIPIMQALSISSLIRDKEAEKGRDA